MVLPIFQVTKGAMRREIARAFGDMIATSGSLATPSTNSFRAPELIFGNANYIKGAEISFFSGGGASIAGNARVIDAATPYSAASVSLYGQVAVLPPWAVAPSINSAWEVHRKFTRQQYDDAISRAIRRVGRRIMVPTSDTTITLATDIYEYSLPTGQNFAYIQDVYIQGSLSLGTYENLVPREHWFINTVPSLPTLAFIYPWFETWVGKKLRIVGQAYPSDPSEETNLPVDPEYVFNRVASDLYQLLPQGSADWRGYASVAADWERRARELERRVMTRPLQGSKPVRVV